MDANSVKERLRIFLLKHIKCSNLADDEDFFATSFVNSLFAMTLVLYVQDEFQLQVSDADLVIENFCSVNAITRFVVKKTSNGAL